MLVRLKIVIRKLISFWFPSYRLANEVKDELLSGIRCHLPENSQCQKNSRISFDSKVGDYTYIGYNNIISRASIGRYCSIANTCSIGVGEHSLDSLSTSSYLSSGDIYKELTHLDVEIKNDVWIGEKVTVRRGVTIGNGAVVGANSFVNRNVPDFAVVGGVPAKIIKYRFPLIVRETISKSEWWNRDLKEAKLELSKLKTEINEKLK